MLEQLDIAGQRAGETANQRRRLHQHRARRIYGVAVEGGAEAGCERVAVQPLAGEPEPPIICS